METSIPCKVYIKSHSLEKQFPHTLPRTGSPVVPPLFGFSVCQVEAREGWGVGPQPREDQSSNPHPAHDRWVFMCKRRTPALTFRHCHEDEKRQPMKGEEPWHTPPGSEYTPASFRVVCSPGAAGGLIFHSLRAAPCGCTTPVDALSTLAPSPPPPTPRKKNET